MDNKISQELDIMMEIISLVNSTLDINKLLDIIMESANKICKAEASSLYLIDKGTDNLLFRSTTGVKGEEVKAFQLKLGEGIAGWVALHGEPLIVEDARKDVRHKKEIPEKIGFIAKSILCVPMKLKTELIGCLEVINKKDGGVFGEHDSKILTSMANQSAVAIENARIYENLNEENKGLRSQLRANYKIEDIIFKSPQMGEIINLAKKVADSKATILIRGESGTGKELIAQAIHNYGSREDFPFLGLNCSAIPDTLLESELFGHEKGSFTGAVSSKKGKFELANGGTLFLDEIGEMPLMVQIKLLRVLQEKSFERVGGVKTITVNIRLITATNKDLEEGIKKGNFREDLYYRLNVVPIYLPALRERKEDIPLLVEHFIQKYSKEFRKNITGVSDKVMEALQQYSWPGNVRELENTIERALVMANGSAIEFEDVTLDFDDRGAGIGLMEQEVPLKDAQNEFKKIYIKQLLDKHNGSQKEVARILKIQRTYLSKLVADLKIKEM